MTVTPQNIADKLGMPAPETDSIQARQWQGFIDDAVLLITLRMESLQADAPSDIVHDYVVREAVVDHIKRPDDATQVTISVDDGSSSRTYQSGKGRVTITDEWWRMLGLTGANAGAYAFDTAPGVAATHLPWCNLMWNASYCSCGADVAGRPIYEGLGL
jgi:hypothetical protein